MTTAPQIDVRHMGRDAQPIAVIDNFFPAATALRASALAASFGPARNLYPGIRAELPGDYWSDAQMRLLHTVIARVFDLAGPITIIDASFSVVTTPPGDLAIGQRLPHADGFSPRQLAIVHYLNDFTEGTGFYRHRATGLQSITEHSHRAYFQAVDAQLRHLGPPPAGYCCGDTPLFEQIHAVPSQFNRAVLYRGQQLHSGAITPNTPLHADPATGRLTVTAFLMVG